MKEYEWIYQDQKEKVEILTPQEFSQLHPELFKKSFLSRTIDNVQFCKILSHKGILSGNFVIPKKNHPIRDQSVFSFVLNEHVLYFIDYEDTVDHYIKDMDKFAPVEFGSLLMYLLDFMSYIITEDVYFLEEYNRKLQNIEMAMYEGKETGVERFIMATRKDMNILANYYLQLSNMGETLEHIIIHENSEEEEGLISLYISRVEQLYSMVQQVKVYTDQIWNLRQTQLSNKQNEISQVLTSVSVIFLPLTLITGWFGMNFTKMPFLHSEAGYYGTFVCCILIVILEIWYIRRKGIWK